TAGFIQAQGRLGQVRNATRVEYFKVCDVCFGLTQLDGSRSFSGCPDHFVMVLMSDQKDGVAFPGVLDGFVVALGYLGTGGVDHVESQAIGELSHLMLHLVSADIECPTSRL